MLKNIIIPDWATPPNIHALTTTRITHIKGQKGVSLAPFDAFNLATHVGDDAQAVAHNRALLREVVPSEPLWLNQTHGVVVYQSNTQTHCNGIPEADAVLVIEPNQVAVIMTADCLPVLFTTRQGTMVAGAHAGWRSLAGQQGKGVLERLLQKLQALCPAADDEGWMAWLGPCIGPRAFEVGDEVRVAFVQTQLAAAACFVAQPATDKCGKWLADLAGLARLRLAAMGVQAIYGNNSSLEWCTFSQPQRFFSYRRDGRTGRMAAAIWLQSLGG